MEYYFEASGTTPNKLKEYSALLSKVFPDSSKFTFAFLTWQYLENPNGTVVGFDAYWDGELVAHYVTIPVIYNINGNITKGLLSLNTATHIKHQGKGLFTCLANMTYEMAKEMDYKFVIGVANSNSTPGFLNKLGFRLVGQLEAKLGIGYVKSGKKEDYFLKSEWSEETLDWRLKNPKGRYITSNNIIYSSTDKPLIYASMGCAKKQINSPPTLLPVKLWIGFDKAKKFKGVFFNIPEFLKPSPLNLIFKDLSQSFPLFNSNDVFFELIDFDAY